MRPVVHSVIWTDTDTGHETRRWHVQFEDSCGCIEETDFASFNVAAGFAYHVAMGGSRWEFIA